MGTPSVLRQTPALRQSCQGALRILMDGGLHPPRPPLISCRTHSAQKTGWIEQRPRWGRDGVDSAECPRQSFQDPPSDTRIRHAAPGWPVGGRGGARREGSGRFCAVERPAFHTTWGRKTLGPMAERAQVVARGFQPRQAVRRKPIAGSRPERYVPSAAGASQQLGLQQEIDVPVAIEESITFRNKQPTQSD
jgi:hypothetical protein